MREELRASNGDREAVLARLARALTEGRISVEEFDERACVAAVAKSHGELDALTADLPRSIW